MTSGRKATAGGRVWTWRLTVQRYAELEAAMHTLAASRAHIPALTT